MHTTARQLSLLRLVVEAFVSGGKPVSSAAVAKRQRTRRLSPATIRSELRRLTALGLLHQAHPSAGRTPTEEGLRVYLNDSLSPKLHPWDRKHLTAAVQTATPAELPIQIGQCLANISGEVAVVAVPRFVGSTYREVGLVRCRRGCFLAYFSSPGGQVQQKLVQVDFDLDTAELQRIQNYLNDRLTNRTLLEVRTMIERELAAEEVRRDRLRRSALEIGLKALPEPEMELVVEGKAHLAGKPEFSDLERLRAILEAIETKTVLLQLLDRIIGGPDVTIMLASEHSVRAVSDLACVSSACAGPTGGRPASVTLMGPSRMDYGRLIPLVRYAKVLLERHWTSF